LDSRFKRFPIIEQLVQLSLGTVPMAELLSFAGFVHLKFIGVSKDLAIGAPVRVVGSRHDDGIVSWIKSKWTGKKDAR
jgi:hypothetical protein